MSPDTFLRGRMKAETAVGPLSGFVAGKVVESKSPKWEAGDLIGGMLPFGTLQVVTQKQLESTVTWKLTGVVDETQISYGVGVLGMPGSTAYGGLTGVLNVQPGETLFVSGAAGAVGGLVGQIAKKVFNCRVIGSCGGQKKCEFIKEVFGFDEAIDYKSVSTAEELSALLKAAAPDGIDMYYENVGGIHFEAAMANLRPGGRVAVCGTISAYNESTVQYVKLNLGQLIYARQRIEGFVASPWLSGQKGNFLVDMAKWLGEGKLAVEQTDFEGIDQWVTGFRSLFLGGNTGKVVVHIHD
jgi:NADPH-dependent curcumin reductase CurA